MKEKKIENRNQRYNEFHEKNKATVKMATITIPADIAKFVMELSDADAYMLEMVCNSDIGDSLWELIVHPIESKVTLESLMFHYLQITTRHEAGSVTENEIDLFSDLNYLFNACIKFQRNQEGGRDE